MPQHHNLPRPLEQSEYERCVDLVKEDVSRNPTVQSAYLMGGEWCPGISDLDIVIVYKDGVPPKPLRSPWTLSEQAAFIFTHRYLSFSESAADLFYFLYPKETAHLRRIAGSDHSFMEVPEANRQWILAAILFDVLVNKLLLLRRSKKGPLHIRQLLGELYSLVYTAWIVREIGGVDIDQGFGERIQALRTNWFAQDETAAIQTLMTLLDEGLELVARAVVELDRFVSRSGGASVPNAVFSNDTYAVTGIDNWSYDRFCLEFDRSVLWNVRLFGKRIASYRLVVPRSLSIFFHAYIGGEGPFSEAMRRQVKVAGVLREAVPLEGHVRAVNKAYESSIASGGLFKIPYTYGLAAKRTLRSRVFWGAVRFLRDL
ncbi:MAG: hypothetical protein PHV99_01730 [Candidatus Pacebacteria bacterium]|nr:hypothetical protein [Candidatus Paceibacterota bacterium]